MSSVMRALETRPFAVVGHRGAPAYEPENTVASFEKALQLGADLIECDIRLTRDGTPVVFHDEDLSRLVGIGARIADLTEHELRSYRVRGQPVPTLEELLGRLAGRAGVLAELKTLEAVESSLEVIKRLGAEKWTALISFAPEALERARILAPSIPRGLIYAKPLEAVRVCRAVGCEILLPRYNLVSPRMVSFAKKMRLKVVAWTVNSAELALKLYDAGVDGMATDDPALLVGVKSRLLTSSR
ncbi:MAG: glycerophosphodiester phosphodiesterase [Fervidicoccaceae archaeon]